MFDRDVLRNQQLIEERIEYENDFIHEEGIIKSEEPEYYAHPQYEEYYDEEYHFDAECYDAQELDLEFDFEDYCNQIRDEQLIEMYEGQIEAYYLEIDADIEEYDPLDAAIDYYCHPREPDYYDYFDAYDDCYVEEIPMDAAYCGGQLVGYVVSESAELCDYDYPEGPCENLWGLRYDEPFHMDCYDFEFPDEFYDSPEQEYEMQMEYGEYLFDNEQRGLEKLINERLMEEKEFFEFVKENEVKDEYLLPIDCDDIILC